MNKLTIILGLLVLLNCSPFVVFSSNASIDTINYWGVHGNALSFSYKFPRWQIGFEKRIDQNAIEVDFGFGNFKLNNFNKLISHGYQFFEIRPTVKHYFSKRLTSSYLAINQDYDFLKQHFNNSLFRDEDVVYYENADYFGYRVGMQLVFGFRFCIYDHFLVDLYAGLGYDYEAYYYTNVQQVDSLLNRNNNKLIFPHSNWKNGSFYYLSASYGLKIGYLFLKR